MSKSVNMHEAKTHLSRFVQELRDGTEYEVIIAVGGVAAARLVAYEARKRPSGMDAGMVEIADDFDADDEVLAQLFDEA